MYNIKLNKNEKINLISDSTIIYKDNNSSIYTSIITTNRYIILDYPSDIFNVKEDLRMIGRLNYIKQKEIIFETNLKNIINIKKGKKYYKIILSNNNYILIKDNKVINNLIKIIIKERKEVLWKYQNI